jgi:hypothetical protein
MSLRVGAAKSDITPSLDVGILMSSSARKWAPFEGVRMPLYARALVVETPRLRVAVVALDLLLISGRAFGGRDAFRRRILSASGNVVPSTRLVLASTHTHSAPDSMALTDLCRTAPFREWTDLLAERIGSALREAVATIRPARLVVGTATSEGLSLNRRYHRSRGVSEIERRVSVESDDSLDESVTVAAFLDDDHPIALVVNATCHPVNEMCIPLISGDYPGVLSRELESRFDRSVCLFLNGAAGNINPFTVSGGAECAEHHGTQLARCVLASLDGARPVDGETHGFRRESAFLPLRTLSGTPARRRLRVDVAAWRLGDAAFVFLPGEPFVETGWALKRASPFPFTAVVGYSEDAVGYIPTETAFDEGGYETGPGLWSLLGRGSEPLIRDRALKALGLVNRSV